MIRATNVESLTIDAARVRVICDEYRVVGGNEPDDVNFVNCPREERRTADTQREPSFTG